MQELAQEGPQPAVQDLGQALHCLCCTGSRGHFAGSSALTQACSQKNPIGALTGSDRGDQWDGDGLQPPWV